jgi:hypothetical protein
MTLVKSLYRTFYSENVVWEGGDFLSGIFSLWGRAGCAQYDMGACEYYLTSLFENRPLELAIPGSFTSFNIKFLV